MKFWYFCLTSFFLFLEYFHFFSLSMSILQPINGLKQNFLLILSPLSLFFIFLALSYSFETVGKRTKRSVKTFWCNLQTFIPIHKSKWKFVYFNYFQTNFQLMLRKHFTFADLTVSTQYSLRLVESPLSSLSPPRQFQVSNQLAFINVFTVEYWDQNIPDL